jgi:hypothetical protein
MDLVSIIKTIFSTINILEIVAVIILTTSIIMMLLTKSLITEILSATGIAIIILVFIFSTIIVKSGYFFFKDSINKKVEKALIVNLLGEEKKIIKRFELDDGSEIRRYSLDKPLGAMKYSEIEAKNSLDKIYNNYGLDTIFYLQDVLLNAKKLEGSSEAVYISLEDYAFMCSMNICNKYLYDFNDVKRTRGGPYLIVVIPEFLSTLENYVP